MTSRSWDVLVPLKGLGQAKSRLTPLAPAKRRRLALAMALDTVSAVIDCPRPVRLHAICNDPAVGYAITALDAGITIHRRSPAGLNAALADTASRLGVPSSARAVAVVLGDLPALRGGDIADVLDQAGELSRAVVADSDSIGTTVLCATGAQLLTPAFGASSLQRHVADGAGVISAAPGVRRDVDILADLDAAIAFGLGKRTQDLLDDWTYRREGLLSAAP